MDNLDMFGWISFFKKQIAFSKPTGVGKWINSLVNECAFWSFTVNCGLVFFFWVNYCFKRLLISNLVTKGLRCIPPPNFQPSFQHVSHPPFTSDFPLCALFILPSHSFHFLFLFLQWGLLSFAVWLPPGVWRSGRYKCLTFSPHNPAGYRWGFFLHRWRVILF